jgi:hypothetical protein
MLGPNITGALYNGLGNNVAQWGGGEGAFFNNGEQSACDPSASTLFPNKPHKFCFDASRSSSIYGGSNIVQPPSLVFNHIIKY